MPFSDIRGHADVIARLQSMLSSGRIASGYLFTGPGGIGKSLLMRRFVQALTCPQVAGPDSCGTCPTCRRIAEDAHPDVHVLQPEDGRKSIGIAVVRALQNDLSLRALEGEGKAALIDEARLLTPESQNSFLRTLEEPPGRTVICIGAESPRAVIPTILSRCQVITCAPLSEDDCLAVLAGAGAEVEELQAMSGDDRRILVRLADGSPGRALHMATSPVIAQRHALLEELVNIEGQSRTPTERLGRIATESDTMTRGKGALPMEDVLWLYGSWARDLVHAAWGRPIDHTDMAGHIEGVAARLGPRECLARLEAVERTRRAFEARNLNARLTLETVMMTLTGGALARRFEEFPL